MARLLGRYTQPRCPTCRRASGLDCADSSPSKRTQKNIEERQWRKEAEDEMSEEQDKREMGEGSFLQLQREVLETQKAVQDELNKTLEDLQRPERRGPSPTYQILDEVPYYTETGQLRRADSATDLCDGTVSCKPTGVAEAVAERMRRKQTWLRTSNRREALERATQLAAGGYGGENAQEVIADAREFEAYLNEVEADEEA